MQLPYLDALLRELRRRHLLVFRVVLLQDLLGCLLKLRARQAVHQNNQRVGRVKSMFLYMDKNVVP